MIIEIPPQIEQAIINKAQSKGMTAESYIKEQLEILVSDFSFLDSNGIYSRLSHETSNESLQTIREHLDQPPNPTPAMRELMANYGGLNV